MQSMHISPIVTLIFEGLLGLFTAYAAYSLFTQTPSSVAKMRAALRYPHWYWMLAGVVATIGALTLFGGVAFPAIGAVAALWMIAYFVVATLTHVFRGDLAHVGTPVVFLVICMAFAWLRWSDITALLTAVHL